jgi:metal-responsive CopG/Arc/MetJ family transcriptional regulator
MATDLKRFTISIPLKMEADLDSIKQKRYYRNNHNDMIRDLIMRGLATLETDEMLKYNICRK